MADKYSVRTWKKDALQAASMRSGVCAHASALVGLDMLAQDGSVFAHGHFDIETAKQFHRNLGISISEAIAKEASK